MIMPTLSSANSAAFRAVTEVPPFVNVPVKELPAASWLCAPIVFSSTARAPKAWIGNSTVMMAG